MAAKSLTTMTEIDLVVFQIARARVERRESRWIADQVDAAAMPMEQLRWLHGRITWCICGYRTTPPSRSKKRAPGASCRILSFVRI